MKIPLFIILFATGLCRAGPLDGLLIPLAERKAEKSEGWWTFSDELVTFELPKEASKVAVSQVESSDVPKPGDRGVSSLTMRQEPRENPFARLYRIHTADGERFGDVLVVDQPWFDESFCFCGPIVAKQFAVENGNLLEFSQMPDGIIKIAQATNGTHRAKLGEWTHAKIPFPDYERIGSSLRLNSPSKRTVEEWIEVTRAKREQTGNAGWLRVGMSAEEVRNIMGGPVKSERATQTYEARKVYYDGTGYLIRYTLPFSGGKLMEPGKGCVETEDIVPAHQVPDEIGKMVRDWVWRVNEHEKARPKGVKPYVVPEDEIRKVKDAFHRDAPFAGGKQWEEWCQLLLSTNQAGVKDQKAAEMVVRRFGEKADLRIREAVEIFEEYAIEGRHRMMVSFVEQVLDSPDPGKEAESFYWMASMAGKGGLLTSGHIRRAVDHPDKDIRECSLLLIDDLPREEAREIIRKRLVDPDWDIRDSAFFIAPRICVAADEGWLRKLTEQEKDPDYKMAFEQLLSGLKERR